MAAGNSDFEAQADPEEGLVRGLTRWHALAIVVGAVLGTGIYIRPASIAQLMGSPISIIAVWVAAGFLSVAGALTYAELANNIPRSGGEYAFLKTTLGELPAFLFGWMRLTVGVGTVGALAVASTVFLSDLLPLGGPWASVASPWSPSTTLVELGPRQVIAVLLILGLATLNVQGVGKAGRFQSWITAAKALSLFALIAAVALLGRSGALPIDPAPATPTPITPSACGAAVLAALAAYNGWANVAMVGGEVQHSRRTLPWALTVGVLIVVGLYVAVNLAYLHALPLREILSANSTAHPTATSVASRAAMAALGPRAGTILPLLFMISAVGTLHSNLLTVPRVLFSMARDSLLPSGLARVSAVARTPAVAIATLASVGSTLAVLGGYDRLTNMAAFGYVLFYALNAIGLLWWRYRQKGLGAATTPGRRWIAALFLAGMLWLLITTTMRGSAEIVAALLLVALGFPVFAFLRHRRLSASAAPR